jgi:hypothetical protein
MDTDIDQVEHPPSVRMPNRQPHRFFPLVQNDPVGSMLWV